MALTLKSTPARSVFKKMMGQNNHFLITILVGLDSVESGEATLSPEFSTSWDPVDVRRSARRSRDFATKALLAWAVDSLDAYRRQLSSPANVYLEIAEWNAMNAEEGLWHRLQYLAQVSGAQLGPEKELVQLLLVWRNKVVHTRSRDGVPAELKQRLLDDRSRISTGYRGLDIRRAIEAASRGDAPSFKEITSLVTAAHNFVSGVDTAIARRTDIDACLRSALSEYLAVNPAERSRNIWDRDRDRRRASILQVAHNYGMTAGDGSSAVSEQFVHQLMSWTAIEARQQLTSSK
ncbi:hypothetical protein M2272_005993 [Mycobacterium frederiksbergense]|uniref:Apea-like HEPN domain-containing protein n=1 Tax=Mycolicibacterium frederiksbergense TaxID=117567 RepID=A0ABT6LAQ6_9MYCO|nr:hypothetical protein [Mycolicibacterium frederiksbergense]MDH6199322.1 hypothetical protein [Mycolicibacterium frederiksbergense]